MRGRAVADADNEASRWYLRAGAWVGIGTGPGALMTGAGIAGPRGLAETVAAVVLGAAAITAMSVATGLLGQRRGRATVQLAERAFGATVGPRVVALLITIGVSCWNGFYLGVAAGALAGLLDLPPPLVAVPLGVVVWRIYAAGFRRWNLLVLVTAMTAIGVAVVTLLGMPSTPPVPADADWGNASLLVGVGMVVAYAAVFAVRVPDFTWDTPSAADVRRCGLAMLVTLTAFLALGAAIYLRTGGWDLADLVNRTAVPAVGASLLVVSAVAPFVSGLHSGALGYARLLGWSPATGAGVVAAVAAVLGGFRFDLLLMPFLEVLGAIVPPVIAVLLLNSARSRSTDAWLAWAVGAAAGYGAMLAEMPAHVLAGITAAGAVMVIAPLLRSPERSALS